MGAWILFALPEIATVTGILGVVAYTLACILPLIMFAVLGPYVRSHSPDGFTISDFIKRRFGMLVHWIVSLISVIFMVVYMTSEMTALSGVIELLTDLDPIIPVAILALITTIYTGKFII
jgi:Na+/proline symporter